MFYSYFKDFLCEQGGGLSITLSYLSNLYSLYLFQKET